MTVLKPMNFMKGKSQADKDTMQLKEIENGRLAMIAFGGMVTQAVATGHSFPCEYSLVLGRLVPSLFR